MGGPDRPARGPQGLRRIRPRHLPGGLTLTPFEVAERPRPGRAPLRILHAGGPGFPPALLDLADAPARVHLRGADVAGCGRCVAVVGSRAASPYGVAMAGRLARDLAVLGYTIVSGLARGIDAAAHRGALAAGGRTVAVVPGGLDSVTPPGHEPLADEVAATGTLLSEFESGAPFGRGAFPRRNRLIAALSAVTVVVEAAERSGALSTAAVARRLGRGLCAVPGDLDRPTARGVLGLLRKGARPCGDANDVLSAIPEALRRPRGAADDPGTDEDPMQRIERALDDSPRTAEALATAAGVPLPETLAALLRLRWAGIASESPGSRWRRAPGVRD